MVFDINKCPTFGELTYPITLLTPSMGGVVRITDPIIENKIFVIKTSASGTELSFSGAGYGSNELGRCHYKFYVTEGVSLGTNFMLYSNRTNDDEKALQISTQSMYYEWDVFVDLTASMYSFVVIVNRSSLNTRNYALFD